MNARSSRVKSGSGDNSSDQLTLKKLDLLTGMQKNEAQLHWTRNNYFLIAASILLLALSQFSGRAFLEGLIASVGFVFAIAWLLIQDRSSRYIGYWKKAAQGLEKNESNSAIYPESLGGVQMRYVAYVLPLTFLVMWATILGALLYGFLN
jgi:hypothetical protein